MTTELSQKFSGPSSFPRTMSLKVVFQICFGSIKMMGTRMVLVLRSRQLSYSIYVSIPGVKLNRPGYPTNVHILILGSCNVQSFMNF
jgi:hypothetical protein